MPARGAVKLTAARLKLREATAPADGETVQVTPNRRPLSP